MHKQIIVIGGGAAGFFAAIAAASALPEAKVTILERGKELLQKVKISGGGRCNVTTAITDPKELIKYYPRGGKQLLNLFYHFNSADTWNWFESKGAKLKSEHDGRVFPVTDNSQTIIDCLISEAERLNINIISQCGVTDIKNLSTDPISSPNTPGSITSSREINIEATSPDIWEIAASCGTFKANSVIIATGGSKGMWKILNDIGHNIIEPVPSLCTFNLDAQSQTQIINKQQTDIRELTGVSVDDAEVSIEQTKLKSKGSVLITHWGFSGPAILKLSAFGARELYNIGYKFNLVINWLPARKAEVTRSILLDTKQSNSSKIISTINPFPLPKRLWEFITTSSPIDPDKKWNDLSNQDLVKLIQSIHQSKFEISGKSTFKEEFVTAGGVDLKEVNMRSMESRLYKNLFFAGEALDIDAVTGGFNFQAAWTTGYIAGISQTN